MDASLTNRQRTVALVSGLRPRTHTGATATRTDVVVALRPEARWAPRDGAQRAMSVASVDAQHRISLTKVASALEWGESAEVVVCCHTGRVQVRAGRPQTPTELPARYTAGRLTLPPTALRVLGVAAGALVVAATVCGSGELVLAAGDDLAALLTGAVAPQDQIVADRAPTGPRSSVRPAFRPAACAG